MGINQWNGALEHMDRQKSVPFNSPKDAASLLESIAEVQGEKARPRQGHAPIDESRLDCVDRQVENDLSSYVDCECETLTQVCTVLAQNVSHGQN